jgi:conjugative transposon TraM protein
MKVDLKKHRKMLVLLPLFVLSVIIILYLGGKYIPRSTIKNSMDSLSRLNTKLPEPNIKEKERNKLEVYMQMQKDSLEKLNEQKKQSNNRFFQSDPAQETIDEYPPVQRKRADRKSLAQHEARVNEQLEKIMQELNHVAEEETPSHREDLSINSQEVSPDIARLEKLMATLQADSTEDPELKQLDAMLDKILRIQQPQTAAKQSYKRDTSQSVIPVNYHPEQIPRPATIFYGLQQRAIPVTNQKPAIKAVVHADQVVQDGSTIKLRLTENIYVGGQPIPANSFVFGTCSISDERLIVQLDRIVHNNVIIPVQLEVFDTDGITGISIPGAITRDAAKKGLDNTLQTLSMTSLDPSMAAQITSAGIQSLKSLLSRKIKQVKVTVKAGHQVYLQ